MGCAITVINTGRNNFHGSFDNHAVCIMICLHSRALSRTNGLAKKEMLQLISNVNRNEQIKLWQNQEVVWICVFVFGVWSLLSL